MRLPLDLDALRSFDAVALHGGVGAAARATRRPKATLSRHLGELEQKLGVRLVERGERRLRLTEDGRRLHERTHGLLIEIDDATEAIASGSDTPRGLLRVSAPVVLAHVALTSIATRFCADYPDVTLDVIAEDRRVDPIEDGYDIVIRINPEPDERLVGRRIASDHKLIVAAPSMTAPSMTAPAGPGVAELPAVVLATSAPAAPWPVRTLDGRALTILPKGRLRVSSLIMARDAAVAGLGVALLPELLVQPDIDAGRLSCWGTADQPAVEIWALHPSRRLVSAKVRVFLAALSALETGQR